MLHVSWEAAAIIGIASFVNMIILAYLLRSKMSSMYTKVETRIVNAFTQGLGDTLADVGGIVVESGVNAVAKMYPQVKEDMMNELGALAGEGIEKMFMKLKMSTMGALGGAAMHDKKLVNELGTILKEEIMPGVGDLVGNPALKFIMGNERIQSFIENNPDAMPLIQRYILPFVGQFMQNKGNAGAISPSGAGQSSFGSPL